MSREPRGVTGHKLVASTDPYLKNQPQVGASSNAVAAASNTATINATTTANGEPLTITNVRQFETLPNRRVKPLPPDASTTNIPKGTKLYQLSFQIFFSCNTCRKNKILSDLLAVNTDVSGGQFTCSRCFTKTIRPKSFAPTRLVPFPSLLSWLNYQKPSVLNLDDMSGDRLAQRTAEAVVPTGDRLATGLAVNGFSNTDVRALPSTGMVHTISSDDQYGQAALHDLQLTHPCNRVWGGSSGKCAHGNLCAFAKAPYKQAIEYLMGIATKEQCLNEGLIVNDVFNLPNNNDPIPVHGTSDAGSSSTHAGAPSASDIHNPSTLLGQWFNRRSKTLNQPEWQLFHNGDVESLIRKYVSFVVGGAFLSTADNDNVGSSTDGNALEDPFAEDVGNPPPPQQAPNNESTHDEEHMARLMEEDEDDDLGALLDAL